MDLFQEQLDQSGVDTLTIRNTKAAVSQFFDFASLPLSKPPIAALLEYFGQLSQLGPGQLIRHGIFRQHSQGCLAKDGIKQCFILWKDTVQDRNGLPFQIAGHVHQVSAVAAQFLQCQQFFLWNIAGCVAAKADDLRNNQRVLCISF